MGSPSLKPLLKTIAAYRERAHKLDRRIATLEAKLTGLLHNGSPGEVVDKLEDEIATTI